MDEMMKGKECLRKTTTKWEAGRRWGAQVGMFNDVLQGALAEVEVYAKLVVGKIMQSFY